MPITRAVHRAGAALRRRHRALSGHGDRGYSVLEAAITLPVLFLVTMFVVQWAIVWHAGNVANAAAQEGLRTAQGYQSSAAAGQADAANFLAQTAAKSLPGATVDVQRTPTTVTVRVHSTVMSVVPFGNFTVDEHATGPVETYVVTP